MMTVMMYTGHNIGSEVVPGPEPEPKVVPRAGAVVPRPVGAPLLDLEPPQAIPQPILPQQSASPVSPLPVSNHNQHHLSAHLFIYFICSMTGRQMVCPGWNKEICDMTHKSWRSHLSSFQKYCHFFNKVQNILWETTLNMFLKKSNPWFLKVEKNIRYKVPFQGRLCRKVIRPISHSTTRFSP